MAQLGQLVVLERPQTEHLELLEEQVLSEDLVPLAGLAQLEGLALAALGVVGTGWEVRDLHLQQLAMQVVVGPGPGPGDLVQEAWVARALRMQTWVELLLHLTRTVSAVEIS